MRVLRKKQRALSNREKLRKCLKCDSECAAWQSTPQNLIKVNMRHFVDGLQETLGKEQKSF